MRPATTAIVSRGVFAGARPAPCGEYALVLGDNLSVAFRRGAEAPAFSLSLDEVVQHVIEGRVRIVGGKLL
ncbi:MAG: hypothetical protein VX640_04030 [Pseudomonadota bacterium]|nr:hypothetical protein [Pseudomonadota bacterium]